MKTKTKALALVLAAVLLVTASVFGTMAYLTSQDTVTNTFTVGKVNITLDEAKVDDTGTAVTPAERVKENIYKLLPGHTYTKDPTVHFAADSEASYLFVKVENGIAGIETKESGKTIAEQIDENGWTSLAGVDNVYYKAVDANTGASAIDYAVFGSFAIDGSFTNDTLASCENATVTVTAYAVQKDGFDSASAAWSATFGAKTA